MKVLSQDIYAPISMSLPLSHGLTYSYRGFSSEYRPNPIDIDIFFQQPIIALQFNPSITRYTFWQEY